MSEAEESAGEPVPGREVWIEKYRPQTLDDIHGQESIVDRLQSYIDENDLPHLLFSGQAGIGKCVTGETPVLTNDGVQRIESVVGDTDGFADATRDRTIVTFDRHGEFDHVSPSHVFRKEATDLRRVVTRDGNEMTVTPEHKFLTAGNEGLAWKTAEDAEPGDRIVRPLEVPLPSGEARLDWLSSMDGDKTLVYLPSEFVAEHSLPVTEGHDEAETDREVCCTLRDVRAADVSRNRVEAQVRGIRYVNGAGRAGRISVPSEMNPSLARFVGLSISEARIENGRIKFYNTDEALLDQFTTDADTLFGITPTVGEQKQVEYREIGNRTLTHFLESCFEVFDANERTDGIGSTLVQADADSRRAFLKTVYDCEGYVSKQGTLELTQKDERVVTLVAYLLSGFGVPARRRKEWKAATNGSGTEREYHTLYVSGSDHLARFADEVGFTLAEKQRRLESGAARGSNPNFDTIPVQSAVDDLCDRLNLDRKEFLPESLNPETPGRDRYQRGVDALLDVASDRIETAQETLERLDELEPLVQRVTALPTVWLTERSELDPISVRRGLAETTGVRKDRLLEYSDGRRTPSASRTGEIVSELGTEHETPPVESVREELHDAVESLGTTYEAVAERVDMHGSSLQSLLEGGNDLRSLTRFQSVLDALRTAATEILSRETLELVSKLDVLASAELYFDEVESVERIKETRDVYDLTVPESRNYVAGQMPTVVHNTTAAQAIAREIYGDNWQQNFLELNASDQRGIDVVRDRIKSFARESFSPDHDHTVIFLDEADSLCLPPGTEILTGYPSSGETKKIEEVAEDGESIPSVDFETNEIQSDSGHLVDSGIADFFEIELSDGREITASPKHPFFVVDGDEKLVEKELRELQPGDEIADFRDDAGVSRCDACGGWTTGRFCSVDCKNDGHSREMQGEGNPMHGTEWSDDRREKIIRKLSDGRLSSENNPNYGGTFEGVHIWEMDEESVERFREMFSEMRSGTSWEEWVTDADAETVKQDIGQSSAEWWEGLDEAEREEVIKKRVESTDYPVCDITGDANPMRDPETAQKVSEALEGHEPTGGNIRYSEELGHLVRSDWEYDVAKKLQDADVEYEYEPAFDLSDSVYHPDFLVGDTIIEVKGVAELWGQTDKVEAFLERYGDEYDFLVVGDGEMPHDEHYEKGDFDAAVVSDGGRATVSTAEVQRIEYSHRGKAYNISMDGTPNFMLANGVLTHNTDDAQSALRRTMEQFSDNTRFILSCNYSSKIIDPIQSRCAVFRFSPLSDDAIESQVREIAETEGIEITEEGMDALVYAADGDMRRAINNLQGAATSDGPVDETTVYEITATARPEEIESMVSDALDGDFSKARATLDTLLTETGIAGGDVIDQLHRSVWEFDLDDREAVRLLERIGEADYRITEGANEQVQLEALLASLALEGE